jgi:hypothetical protein
VAHRFQTRDLFKCLEHITDCGTRLACKSH